MCNNIQEYISELYGCDGQYVVSKWNQNSHDYCVIETGFLKSEAAEARARKLNEDYEHDL